MYNVLSKAFVTWRDGNHHNGDCGCGHHRACCRGCAIVWFKQKSLLNLFDVTAVASTLLGIDTFDKNTSNVTTPQQLVCGIDRSNITMTALSVLSPPLPGLLPLPWQCTSFLPVPANGQPPYAPPVTISIPKILANFTWIHTDVCNATRAPHQRYTYGPIRSLPSQLVIRGNYSASIGFPSGTGDGAFFLHQVNEDLKHTSASYLV